MIPHISAYTFLIMLGIIVALLIWVGVVNINSLINDVLASVLAGVAGAYVVVKLFGSRKRR